MKLTLGLAAAFAGCSAATAQPAGQVFTFPARGSSSTASLGRSEAHLILLQRLASPGNEPSILDIPTDINGDRAVELITKYGREIPGLFDDTSSKDAPRRLLVMVEGMTQKQMQTSQKALRTKPMFSIHDPPSTAANEELFEDDLFTVDAKPKEKCSLADVLKMKRSECWNKQSTAVKYNVEQTPAQLDDMLRDLAMLSKLATDGKVESTVVFIPTAAEVSNAAYWSDISAELRRRQSEAVMTAPGIDTSSSTSIPGTVHKVTAAAAAKHKKILACYTTKEDCNAATASCSGHGKCVDKNHRGEKKLRRADELEACFACQCAKTSDEAKNSTTTWAGPACSKMDISSPFWLFVSASLVVVFAVYLAVGLLFAVGEEKLPGVIGAGVSKSK